MSMKFTKYGFIVLVVLCCAFFIPGAVSANLVKNGGFENSDQLQSWGGLSVPQAGSLYDWNLLNGDLEVIGNGYWVPESGSKSIDLSGLSHGTISQDLSTISGQRYTLTFAMSGNPDSGEPTHIRIVNVYWGDDPARQYSFDTSGISYQNMKWEPISILNLEATSSSTMIKFEDVSPTYYGSVGAALDDIVVEPVTSPVPEFPSVFLPATMIIGFLGAVLLIQRIREN
jgi:choice-of-anchor C domain-containing protein